LLLIVATATTRLYAPRMSRLLVEHDVPAQQRLLRRRALGMSVVCGAFMTLVVLFGKPILGLFGPEFERGASSLVVYSIGTSLNLIFAFAPWYLQFRKRHTLVLALTGVGTALTMGAMLFVPWPDMPAYERVVLWYSVGLILLFITLRMLAVLELRRARGETANASLAHAEA
jgi:O-antigen/teichoic acid export membrane protein